jgi:predicted PurR-regulated permease PerM
MAADPASPRPPVVEVKNHDAMTTLVSGTHTLLAGLGLAALVLYFFLGWGDLFLRKLIRALPTLTE